MFARSVFLGSILLAAAPASPAFAQDANAGSASPAADATAAPTPAATPTGLAPAPGESAGLTADATARPLSQRFAELWHAEGSSPEERLDEVRKLRDQNQLRAVPGIARALTAEGYRALDGGNLDLASERFHGAVELDPSAADARLGLAAVEGGGKALSTRAFSDLWRAARTRLNSLRSMPYVSARWIVALASALTAAGILAILALVVRRQGLLRHDVEEAFKRRLDPEVARVVGWLVLLLPLLLTFDLYWAALFWAAAIWAYLEGREQAIVVVSLVLAAAAVPAAGLAARLLQNTADPYTRAAVDYLDGVVEPMTLQGLEEYASARPDQTEARLLTALVYERNGEPRRAIAVYRQLLDKDKNAAVYNNIANVYFRLDEKDRAFESWKKALELDPGYALAHYNLSVYYFGFFEFDKKDEHFNKAKGFDAKAVDRWVTEGAGVVDARPEREVLRRRLWLEEREGEPKALEQALRSPHTIAALAALIVGFAWGRKRRLQGVAAACVKCGAAFCHQCKPGKEREDYCLQCVHLFIRKDGVSPQMRAEKVKEIAANQFLRKLRSTLLNLVAPGAGAIYRERPLLGFPLLAVWCLGLTAYLVLGRGVSEPGFLARASQVVPAWLALIPAGAVWLLANLGNALRKD